MAYQVSSRSTGLTSTPQKPRCRAGAPRIASMSCWSWSGERVDWADRLTERATATSAALFRQFIQLLDDLVVLGQVHFGRARLARTARVDVAAGFAERHALFLLPIVELSVNGQ